MLPAEHGLTEEQQLTESGIILFCCVKTRQAKACLEGFYQKPRVDWELLTQYHEGLIALSGCLAGEIPQLLLSGDYAAAKQTALNYQAVFGAERYYLEVQNHGLQEQKTVLPLLEQLSRETGIPLVATSKCCCAFRREKHWMTPPLYGLKPKNFT